MAQFNDEVKDDVNEEGYLVINQQNNKTMKEKETIAFI